MADEIGFTETAAGKLAVVVTEVATNLVKYAQEGQIVLHKVASSGIEVLAFDKGPGMASIADCMRDGYSTAGSAGTGLGAISRMSSDFDLYSLVGSGTILRAYCDSGHGVSKPTASSRWQIASLVSPVKGETDCGDAVSFRESRSMLQLMVVDGLGHGPLAADAALAAVRVFEHSEGGPVELIEKMHRALRATRGAAVAIAQVEPERGKVRYCGVGNIVGLSMADGKNQHMVSMNGIVGGQAIRTREFEYDWHAESLLVMHSDGISSRWSLSHSPGILTRQPSMIGASIFRDMRRVSDDATIVVGRML